MTIYERIKELRTNKGLSQQELARLTGYQDRSSIAKIESGSVDLPQSKIISFAHVLGVTPAFLLGLEEEAKAFHLSEHEKKVLIAYRSHPEMHAAVDCLLQIESEAVDNRRNA